MLVLSRKEGERLVIGENIVITVNRISGNRITLGIDAPRDVRVVRGELELHEQPQQDAALPASDRCNLAFEVDIASLPSRVAG
jgi:carbon storage regulator